MAVHYILDSSNARIGVTNLQGGASSVTMMDALPLTTSDGSATGRISVPVFVVGGSSSSEPTGATNLASSQVTATTTAGTLVIARPTRNSVLFRNLDTSISVYIGKATVTSANGMLLKAGESIPFTYTGLIQVIAASGTPIIAIADEYS